MAFPTTSVLDNFNRANEGPPPSTSWDGPIRPGQAQLKVSSNAMIWHSSVPGSVYWDTSFDADQECYLTVSTKGQSGKALGLFTRLRDHGTSSVDGYELWTEPQDAATDNWRLYRMSNNGFFLINSTTQEVDSGDKIGIESDGSTHKGYLDDGGGWSEVNSGTDATFSHNGEIGVFTGASNNVLDDFGGGAISAGATTHEGAGTLAASSAVTGVATITSTQAGTLAVTNAVTGISQADFEGVGPISLNLTISGINDLVTDQAGTLAMSHQITGVSGIDLQAAGSLLFSAALSGVSDISIEGAGSLALSTALAGSVLAEFDATASIDIIAGLSATVLAELEANGELGLTPGLSAVAGTVLESGATLSFIAAVSGTGAIAETGEITAPDGRTLKIQFDDRTMRIEYDDRTLKVEH